MARRYQIDELLLLRDSPLAVKPDSLPPAEEWMGPIADATAQKKHAPSRDQADTTNRRPSIFENRHISRASNSDELVLGPPKTSFASATRGFGKSYDTTDKPSTRPNDDEPRNDRFNFRDKFIRDKEFPDRDSDRRDGMRPSMANGRRGGRDDKEDWSSGRPRRTFGQDDTDRRPKRGGESDRWDGRGDPRDQRDQQEPGNERFNRDNRDQGRRFPQRRDGPGRGRHDQNWFRDGDGQDLGDNGETKTPLKHREWRRGLHNAERDWNRHPKQEQDPEWMDPSDKQEPREAHTQEDFQRWKERMKAGSNQAAEDANKETFREEAKVEPKAANNNARRADGEMFSRLDSTSFKMDAGMDNFFDLWGENKSSQDTVTDQPPGDNISKEQQQQQQQQQQAASRPAKSSRFAGLFNAPADTVKATQPVQAETARPASTDADQEGFQRILQMLGGNKSNNATPQVESPAQPRPAPPQAAPTDFSREQATMMVSPRERPNGQDFPSYPENPGREQHPGLENLVGQNSAADVPPQKRDTEFLLRLMQQSKLSQTPNDPQAPHLPNPGGINIPDVHPRAQGSNDPRDQFRRRPTGGAGYFDDITYHQPSASNQAPGNPPGIRPQGAGQPPIGLQRPPGLEQVVSPGWSNQQIQQSASNQPLVPPGLANHQTRNANPGFPSGPPMPMSAGASLQSDRQGPFQRGGGSNGPGGFGPPPGIAPPPGYMNVNAPPPSAFPPMPHGPEGMMGMPHGNPAPYGGPHQQSQNHQARQLLDMFSQPSGGPNDGAMGRNNGMGMMGPGGYR